MYNILTLNKIAKCGLDQLNPKAYTITDDATKDADGIILRSFSMHEMEFPKGLLAVARAGAGVNNIPIDRCSEEGIVVFNTPGANANAVKELTIAGLFLASRDIMGGIEWAKTLKEEDGDVAKQVEKGKSAFVGPEIEGKTLGVIGLGAIGIMVANAAIGLGMKVIGYDPYLSVDAAWKLSRNAIKATELKDIYANCDYITLHLPLNDGTRGMINTEAFDQMKKGVRLLNFSRAALVDTDALKRALFDGTVAKYVVDFPDADVIGLKNVVPIPHLGASTPESEDNCAVMAAKELADYLENGNIKNSVNLPNCVMERETAVRVTIIHKNVPNMLSGFSSVMAEKGINIEHMMNKSKKDYAYTIMDIDGDITDEALAAIENNADVLKVRVIR
ncbi:MAG: phosphoglycerate dehydrogenase [Clostridia bacterium]|nr:phosphoglycerate dehydrogenase [Clostridia bacterium]